MGHHHGHEHFHGKKSAAEKPQEKAKREEWVTATINGDVVSWINDYNPGAAATTAAAAAGSDTGSGCGSSSGSGSGNAATTPTTSDASTEETESSNSSSNGSTDTSGGYTRSAYYSAGEGTADGVTFLGNYGGTGSGVFT